MRSRIKKFFAPIVALTLSLGFPIQGWTAACIPPAIQAPSTLAVAPGASAALSVSLGIAAPAGGVSVTLVSSDSSKVTVSPSSLVIPAGLTAPQVSITVNGIAAGTANVTVSAPGFTSTTTVVTVANATTGGAIILPNAQSVMLGSAIDFPVTLASPAPAGGLTVTFGIDNIYIVGFSQSSISFNEGSTTPTITPKAYGTGIGVATLTASAPGLGSFSVTVQSTAQKNVSVTWGGACLVSTTIYGITGLFQAISYDLSSPVPLTLNGTLFYEPDCPDVGGDNLNDFETLYNPGDATRGFSHNANVFPVSAMYWFGPPSTDGMCYPGVPCSGCVNYTASTPGC